MNEPSDFANTLVLPQDELSARRAQKRAETPTGRLTPEQVQRLLKAAEDRKKS
jgi:hypothetical protein